MPGPDAYHPPERRPHPRPGYDSPGMRECHYLRTENAISPVSDTDFYGTEPLRISQAPSVQNVPAPRPANPDRDGEAAGKCPAEPTNRPPKKSPGEKP